MGNSGLAVAVVGGCKGLVKGAAGRDVLARRPQRLVLLCTASVSATGDKPVRGEVSNREPRSQRIHRDGDSAIPTHRYVQ
jgi:hypothetical protein